MMEVTWLSLIAICPSTEFFFKERITISGIALGVLLNVTLMLKFDIHTKRQGCASNDAILNNT